MKKVLLSLTLVGGLILNTEAQNKKATTKTQSEPGTTKTISTTTTITNNTKTSPQTDLNLRQEATTTSSGTFFQRLQSNSNGESIKAENGNITLEANVNLLSGNVGLSNSLRQIRGRYFLSNDIAARLGAHLSFNNTSPAANTKNRTIEFSIAPGIEKHFTGTNRLSPYIGAEVVLGYKNAHAKTDGGSNPSLEIKGSFGANDNTNRGYVIAGIGAVGGFDFYVARHLFVGYELNMELSYQRLSKIETTVSGGGMPTLTTENTKSTSVINFGPNVRNGVRVGFVF